MIKKEQPIVGHPNHFFLYKNVNIKSVLQKMKKIERMAQSIPIRTT